MVETAELQISLGLGNPDSYQTYQVAFDMVRRLLINRLRHRKTC
ncbi:MAG: hypothetical protein RBR28_11230 [Lentimicrobium sp.]|jgi:hypothetical protein|nr:hypothetical protein [Lentimicrobium sp.]